MSNEMSHDNPFRTIKRDEFDLDLVAVIESIDRNDTDWGYITALETELHNRAHEIRKAIEVSPAWLGETLFEPAQKILDAIKRTEILIEDMSE